MSEETTRRDDAEDPSAQMDAAPAAQDSETVIACASMGDAVPAEEPETEAEPAPRKMLGMSPFVFRGVAMGFAIGMILSGLLKLENTYPMLIACAIVGYLVADRMNKKANAAEKDAERAGHHEEK